MSVGALLPKSSTPQKIPTLPSAGEDTTIALQNRTVSGKHSYRGLLHVEVDQAMAGQISKRYVGHEKPLDPSPAVLRY